MMQAFPAIGEMHFLSFECSDLKWQVAGCTGWYVKCQTAVWGPELHSHEPGDGAREEVLIVKADVARHGVVFLPEELRHALQLGADVDEAIQLHAGTRGMHAEAPHQWLGELGTQVVAHLCEG